MKSAHPGLVQRVEAHIVLIGQRPTTGNDVSVFLIADGLELPDRIDKLQISHMVALIRLNPVDQIIDLGKRQFSHCVFDHTPAPRIEGSMPCALKAELPRRADRIDIDRNHILGQKLAFEQ